MIGNLVVAIADVAQLVEHHLAKVRVASSNLVIRSIGNPAVGRVSCVFSCLPS